METMACKI